MRLRRAIRGANGLWLAALFVLGCSRAPVGIPHEPVEAYPFRRAQDGVRVAVDPFFTVDRLQVSFSGGEEFPDKGLLPVQVIIENGGPEDIRVSARDFRLIRPNGKAESALTAYDAFAMVKLAVGWWGLGAGVIGGSVPAYRNEARLKDIESRALQETTIPRGKAATGFVYFTIPENELNLAGSRILFSLKRPAGWDLTYEVPITGRRDVPVSPKATETAEPPTAPGPAPEVPTRREGTGGRGVIIQSPAQ